MNGLPPPLRALPAAAADGPVEAVEAARDRLRAAGVKPLAWSNGPGETYGAHSHDSTKLLVCAEGEITFFVGDDATPVRLRAGEGFVLPAGTRHSAQVGSPGCVCVEGHRR